MLYLTNPDNIGVIQLILALNTLILTGSYWGFQWIYGVDPMTYSMRPYMEQNYPDAFKQDKETAAAEFALVAVRTN